MPWYQLTKIATAISTQNLPSFDLKSNESPRDVPVYHERPQDRFFHQAIQFGTPPALTHAFLTMYHSSLGLANMTGDYHLALHVEAATELVNLKAAVEQTYTDIDSAWLVICGT